MLQRRLLALDRLAVDDGARGARVGEGEAALLAHRQARVHAGGGGVRHEQVAVLAAYREAAHGQAQEGAAWVGGLQLPGHGGRGVGWWRGRLEGD